MVLTERLKNTDISKSITRFYFVSTIYIVICIGSNVMNLFSYMFLVKVDSKFMW